MLLCVDVHYEERAATAACVGFSDWSDADPAFDLVLRSEIVPEPYEAGLFYKREMPHLRRAIDRVRQEHSIDAVLVDAHVWLAEGKPGLGAHLYEALGGRIAVVGVAKSAFRGGEALPILRGTSRHPLFVTAVGMDAREAAQHVRAMHGAHRIPTLLKRADRLSRGRAD
ncbi:MAG: endonuclease V [Myxococcales bacterium]